MVNTIEAIIGSAKVLGVPEKYSNSAEQVQKQIQERQQAAARQTQLEQMKLAGEIEQTKQGGAQ